MEKIKVLHVGLSPNLGGLESFVHNMYSKIDRSRVSFDFLNTYNDKLAYEDEYRASGSTVIRIVPRKKNPILSYKQLKKTITDGAYDYVHFHCMTFCWPEPIIITSKISNTRIIVHSHLTGFNSHSSQKEKILHQIGKFRVRKTDMLRLACGKEAGEWLFPGREFTIIENGIDFGLFRYSATNRQTMRSFYGFESEDIVIGHVGNFSYQKNYPYLIDLFTSLHAINPHYKLFLIGNDKLANEVKTVIKERNLEKNVVFTGLIKNVNLAYSAMDLYLFPSHYEGLNISLIEAQCSGLNCFVSDKLDKDSNVGGLYHEICIDQNAKTVAEIINSYKFNQNRESIKISSSYDNETAAAKLMKFYSENI